MNDKVFVDTNILIYARDATYPEQQARAAHWMASLWRNRTGRLSFQVLQEYYVNVTQKLKPGLAIDKARQDIRRLLQWQPERTDAVLLESAWALSDRFGFSWWDAQIVAAAKRSQCALLLSEDLQDGLDIDGLQIVNPFVANRLPG